MLLKSLFIQHNKIARVSDNNKSMHRNSMKNTIHTKSDTNNNLSYSREKIPSDKSFTALKLITMIKFSITGRHIVCCDKDNLKIE